MRGFKFAKKGDYVMRVSFQNSIPRGFNFAVSRIFIDFKNHEIFNPHKILST